ncbi:hypothetical protein ACFSHS_16900 [Blastococcus deserti]|uniref:Phage integrase family protein n=1 Tax=Blastococcus deserti TaxID=2259033 RepID=A0ABW4XGV1_9ACTN
MASPHLIDTERPRGQSNCAKALAACSPTPECPGRRRTPSAAPSRLHEAGVPLVQIADQLGHADPAMTARVYLRRDLMGGQQSVADALDG